MRGYSLDLRDGAFCVGLPARAAVLFSPASGPAYYVDRFIRAVGLPAERTDGMVRQLVERVGRPMESLDAVVAARSADVPALIVHDPRDREVSFEFAERMRDAWRGSRLVPAPSLGHKRILGDARMIETAVDFVRSLPRSWGKSVIADERGECLADARG